MARVPLVQDDDEAARATGIFDTFKDEARPPSDIFRALANAPGLMTATDVLFGELEAALGRAGAMELIVVVSQYEAVARIIQALGLEVEADHEQHLADWGPADARL
jgi:hypothetical protein